MVSSSASYTAFYHLLLKRKGESMKKQIAKWCNIAGLVLIVCFVIKTIVDYSQYSSTLNSAPFYVWIVANAVYFILPSAIILIAGVIVKKKK